MDCGANVECTAQMLDQFGAMAAFICKRCSVWTAARGACQYRHGKNQGRPLQLEAYGLMEASSYHFIGNVEARDVPFGACDVLVADGFTGNMLLKMYEGVAGAMMANIKGIFKQNAITKAQRFDDQKWADGFQKADGLHRVRRSASAGYLKAGDQGARLLQCEGILQRDPASEAVQ